MIYVFGGFIVVQGLVIAYLIWSVLELHNRQREDTAMWADRLQSIKAPASLNVIDRASSPLPRPVHYVDEAREVELQGS